MESITGLIWAGQGCKKKALIYCWHKMNCLYLIDDYDTEKIRLLSGIHKGVAAGGSITVRGTAI
jgi:hypothetical protein